MSKRLIATGTIFNQTHPELGIDFRDITVQVGSDEVEDTFTSRAAVPHQFIDPEAEINLTSAHLTNSFVQTQGQINDRKNSGQVRTLP